MSIQKKTLLFIGDALALYFSLAIALIIRYQEFAIPFELGRHLVPFSIIFPLWLLIFYWNDLYRHKAFRDHQLLLRLLLQAITLSGITSVLLFYLFPIFFAITPKTNLLILSIVALAVMYLWRARILSLFVSRSTNIIILGNSKNITEVESFLSGNPHTGFRIVKTFRSEAEFLAINIQETIKETGAHIIVVGKNFGHDLEFIRSLYKLIPLEISILRFSDFYEIIFEKEPLEELGEEWFIENISVRRPMYDTLKRTFDLIFSIILFSILIPLWLLISITIKLSSRGPIIYKQTRVGKNKKLFTIYKFRSMYVGSEKIGPQLENIEKDNRITPIGNILRRTHLDETPQLVNIIKGDCSFVGPRPEWLEFVKIFEKEIPFYEIRHTVRPGLTGHAQINLKYGTSIEDGKEKLAFDVFYIRSRSFIMDIFIILRTAKLLFVKHI